MKFKVKSKSVKKRKNRKRISPSIYRSIAESFKNHFLRLDRRNVFRIYSKTLKVFTIIVFIAAVVILGYDLYKNIQEKEELDFERKKIAEDIKFWESFLEKNNGYRDGYLRLSVLEYKLRNLDLARAYLDKALKIDPNFEKAKELEKAFK